MRLEACTVQRRDGSFCDAPSMEDAPFPICPKHARELAAWLSAGQAPTPRVMMVYYVRTGDGMIKIGTGSRVRDRLNSQGFRRQDLLATEPGGFPLEQARHRQFKELLVAGRGREIFHPGEELLSHIDMLVRHFGSPVLDDHPRAIVEYPTRGGVSSQPSTRREASRAMDEFFARRQHRARPTRED